MKEQRLPYRRLYNLGISGARATCPEQVVKHLGALQAQDYHQALWAIGLRMKAPTAQLIEQSIADRKLVLTWPMRGTIHFVPPENVRWMLQLSASRILAQDGRRLMQLELTLDIIEQCKRMICGALEERKRMTRPELMLLLEEAGIRTDNQRGYHLLWYLAQSGILCMGPREGKQQTFVLLDEWVPKTREVHKDEALAMLATTYFTSHGPATVHDFAWWAGITLSDARKGADAVQSQLASFKVNDQIFWQGASDVPEASHAASSVYLLPGFDEHLLGYKDRTAVLKAEYAPHIIPGNNGVFMPTIVIDGQVAGIWKRTVKKKGLEMEFHLFAPHQGREDEIVECGRKYGEFMGRPLVSTAFQIKV